MDSSYFSSRPVCLCSLVLSEVFSMVGRLLGNYGSTVAQVQQATGAVMKVAPSGQYFNSAGDRVVTIYGDKKQVNDCLKHTINLIGHSNTVGEPKLNSLKFLVNGHFENIFCKLPLYYLSTFRTDLCFCSLSTRQVLLRFCQTLMCYVV